MKIVLDAEWENSPPGYPIYWTDKIHCIVCKDLSTTEWYEFSEASEHSLEDFKSFISKVDTIIAHNLIGADLHVFHKRLEIFKRMLRGL